MELISPSGCSPMLDGPAPRIFALPPGVDFAEGLARGLADRLADTPPEGWAKVTVLVPNDRLKRRLLSALCEGAARLLPRIRLLQELENEPFAASVPKPSAPLKVRLELRELILKVLDAVPHLAPRAAAYDMADSLAQLIDEMQSEAVPLAAIRQLDTGRHAAHWGLSREVLDMIGTYLGDRPAPTGAFSHLRALAEAALAHWRTASPTDPVLIAGSTGSRGATRLLMESIAQLPQGAVILPGFDLDQPDAVWNALRDPLTDQDHPQYRYAALLRALDLAPSEVKLWHSGAPPAPDRNRLILRLHCVRHRSRTNGA